MTSEREGFTAFHDGFIVLKAKNISFGKHKRELFPINWVFRKIQTRTS